MDVFEFRDSLIGDYSEYVGSFMEVRDDRIRERVEANLSDGRLWPDPSIGLNPAFESGGLINDLVAEGLLHDRCRDIFRVNKTGDQPLGSPMKLHRHQREAIERARAGRSYVLTTGTGSGKSLAYIVPIVDRILRAGSGEGVKALVVYPMNALANSQLEELGKFLGPSGSGSGVTYARYTGQEPEDVRDEIRRNPPDILLTNYVMLELILTHTRDQALVKNMAGLQFMVLDELHTYRGRQGADVAFLCRRLREASGSPDFLTVGTSATMSTEGSHSEQRATVAGVASMVFGTTVLPEDVIGETLRRATPEIDLTSPTVVGRLTERVRRGEIGEVDHAELIADPLSSWIESTFGLSEVDGRLVRQVPRPLRGPDGGAGKLAGLVGLPVDECEAIVRAQLMAGYKALDPVTGFPTFAFRLHQFISRGDTVYASPESESQRHLTLDKQRFVPGDRGRVLLPLAFCRSCGQEYYVVSRVDDPKGEGRVVIPRDMGDLDRSGTTDPGFLYVSESAPWPDDPLEAGRLPDDFLEWTSGGEAKVRRDYRDRLPVRVGVTGDGHFETGEGEGTSASWVPAPFRMCLNCGVSYDSRGRDFGKLTTLGSEGRSTATTVLSLSAVRQLRADETLEAKAKKLLSFTDNRQDASLQAGHFNDFVQVAMLRGALYRAVSQAGDRGLEHQEVPQAVFDALDLPFRNYSVDPDVEFAARERVKRDMRDVLAYRTYLDLRRGWRVTSPNLEQCGLLVIDYESLDELAAAEQVWGGCHPALAGASPEERAVACRVLLDFFRRDLAIKTEHLRQDSLDQLASRSQQSIIGMWSLDDGRDLEYSSAIVPRSRQGGDYRAYTYLSSRGGFGRYLRRVGTFAGHGEKLKLVDTDALIADLFAGLKRAGLLEVVGETKDDVGIYQVPASAMRWRAGDGTTPYHDVIRMPSLPAEGMAPNEYFVEVYSDVASKLLGMEAREHTAQVPYEQRQQREDDFRSGDLPVLYCSPTMELGVDISQLNVVNMRNVPPTPANYAQRSGRAGRSGQPALVFTYCSGGSPHDQYFFRRPELMVSGQVSTPRLDLANEDLVRSHVHAIWLAASGMSLGSSLVEILDVDLPDLPLRQGVDDDLRNPSSRRKAAERVRSALAEAIDVLEQAPWWSDGWVDDTLNNVPREFRRACERWRNLYRSSMRQFEAQNVIIANASASHRDKMDAKRMRREAENQMALLTMKDDSRSQSDFYSYRYFASEGFLPGYNFPRLPLSAFIPGRRGRFDDPEYLNRPRFLAVSEFGPQALVYHEGARYRINKVILPVAEGEADGAAAVTISVKRCDHCGYMHPITDPPGPDMCDHCGRELPAALKSMFRMQNVSTRRVDRISSDEEERQRSGYELQSGVRFAVRDGRLSVSKADLMVGDRCWANLTYGDTATISRINLGWRRRKDSEVKGFVIDLVKGKWEKSAEMADDPADPMGKQTARVIPYVDDSRNALLVEPTEALDLEVMASVGTALKHAIQRVFQLEDGELAVESLPDQKDRRSWLLYEASEGGAGVLRRLVDESGAFARVAAEAMEVCHFDSATGIDRGGVDGGEPCEAACYDCLLSYRNQTEHQILDRKIAAAVLGELRASEARPVANDPIKPTELMSPLEEDWLAQVRERGLKEPDAAQVLIEGASTRPDFVYRDEFLAVYIDGPHHEYPERKDRDEAQMAALRDLGWSVVRFGYKDDWASKFEAFKSVFGKGRV